MNDLPILNGKYKLRAIIGSGGFGDVYRAVDLSLKREVAVKILKREISDNYDLSSRFLSEARLTSRLTHPNTLTIHDFGKHEGMLFLVSELLHGETLRDRINKRGGLKPRFTAALLIPVCKALHEAHSMGIVHRDLKPENLFIHKSTDEERMIVLDFGIAKSMENMHLTQTGQIFGTPLYMAPEQIKTTKDVTSLADIYSLGIILYETLSGVEPYQGGSVYEIFDQHVRGDIPLLADKVSPDLAPLDHLIHRMLAKDPAQRPQTTLEVAELLQECLASLPPDPKTLDLSLLYKAIMDHDPDDHESDKSISQDQVQEVHEADSSDVDHPGQTSQERSSDQIAQGEGVIARAQGEEHDKDLSKSSIHDHSINHDLPRPDLLISDADDPMSDDYETLTTTVKDHRFQTDPAIEREVDPVMALPPGKRFDDRNLPTPQELQPAASEPEQTLSPTLSQETQLAIAQLKSSYETIPSRSRAPKQDKSDAIPQELQSSDSTSSPLEDPAMPMPSGASPDYTLFPQVDEESPVQHEGAESDTSTSAEMHSLSAEASGHDVQRYEAKGQAFTSRGGLRGVIALLVIIGIVSGLIWLDASSDEREIVTPPTSSNTKVQPRERGEAAQPHDRQMSAQVTDRAGQPPNAAPDMSEVRIQQSTPYAASSPSAVDIKPIEEKRDETAEDPKVSPPRVRGVKLYLKQRSSFSVGDHVRVSARVDDEAGKRLKRPVIYTVRPKRIAKVKRGRLHFMASGDAKIQACVRDQDRTVCSVARKLYVIDPF